MHDAIDPTLISKLKYTLQIPYNHSSSKAFCFSLSIAFAHRALFGVDTVEGLAQFDLSKGEPEIPLRWKLER